MKLSAAIMSMHTNNCIMTLNAMCLNAVSEQLDVLGSTAILGLPEKLLRELLPYLDVIQLDELQAGLNLKGISTLSSWVELSRRLQGRGKKSQVHTEQDVKQAVMEQIFATVINDWHLSSTVWKHLNTSTLFLAAAKSINSLTLSSKHNFEVNFVSKCRQTPVLSVLEKTVTKLTLWLEKTEPREKEELLMGIIHRLVQHGVTKHVILRTCEDSLLSKVLLAGGCLSGERTRDDEEEDKEGPPAKKHKYVFCEKVPTYTECSKRAFEHLELVDCSSSLYWKLTETLPSCSNLTSLTLRSHKGFSFLDVMFLARALKARCSHVSLRRLSIETLKCPSLLTDLLHACPRLTELNVTFESFSADNQPLTGDTGELPLKRLSVKLTQQLATPTFLLPVLRRCPCLARLHVQAVRLQSQHSHKQLLSMLSECNGRLTCLHLENLNMSDCLHQILNVVRACKLEELRLHDCRLLEQESNKQESLRLLVSALKATPSLRKLMLSQNRLARDVHVLAELFSGPTPSSVEHLDVRLNSINSVDLMHFAEAMTACPPPRHLTLDLRENLGDHDKDEWNAALDKLRPLCQTLVNCNM
ncbi:leucine-rich repeat-containing protein 41-like isoform X1 [Entelurus aequoreus]|uniref:leucine-rich repeat-containing protein 41-like isoform X1 n=2 Tax=Entelurus aequoreus TaxID=161455 RepID=UPI002B1E8CD8|nr:leucine-rich repeat-containing protein 41-like isoform X1 [Entelurus aequoreus]